MMKQLVVLAFEQVLAMSFGKLAELLFVPLVEVFVE
jgi:hypothetical protein